MQVARGEGDQLVGIAPSVQTGTIEGIAIRARSNTRRPPSRSCRAAVVLGRFDPDLVAVEARRHGPGRTALLIVLPATALSAARQVRPAPGLGAYDELLGVGA